MNVIAAATVCTTAQQEVTWPMVGLGAVIAAGVVGFFWLLAQLVKAT